MTDNRVRPFLLDGMRDLQNLLVHLQTVLGECEIPVVRAGGGMTFSGFSLQVAEGAPVDWFGYYINRPDVVIYEIQDRILPEDCPLAGIRNVAPRRYERVLSLRESPFLDLDERGQMELLRGFLQETVEYLRTLPTDEDTGPPDGQIWSGETDA